ncbi:MAG: tetratricopeptide repeat protein [Candidatus Desantisbacteria bacterium]
MSKYIWMLSIIAIFFSSPGFCAFKVKGYGFVSLPDNVDSLWVNPASLAQIPERELMTSYRRLYYNLNYGRVGRSMVGYGQPVGNNIGMGIDWTNLSLNGYEELCYTLACGYRVSDSFKFYIKEMFAWEMERQIDSSLMQDVESLEKISAYNELGRLYIENGLYQRALNSFERGMSLCPEDKSIYLWIGDIHYRLNQYESAVNAYEKYIDAHTDDALAYRHLGAAYYALSEYKMAEAAFGKAAKLASADKGNDPDLIMDKDDTMIKDKGRQKVEIDFVWEEDRNPIEF